MDYLTQHFIVWARKEIHAIIERLNGIDKTLQRQVESKEKTGDTADKHQYAPTILRAELKIPHSEKYKNEAKAASQLVHETWKLYVEIFTLLVIVGYTTVAAFQLGEMISARHQTAIIFNESKQQFQDTLEQMKGQTKAQQDATNVARNSLEVSQRAYLTVEIGDIDFTDRKVVMLLANVGHIPPNNVTTTVHEATVLRPPGEVNKPPFPPAPTEEMHWTRDVITGQMWVNHIQISVRLPNVDAVRLKNQQQKVFIVGTVTYNDGFPNTRDQATPFCFATGIHSGEIIWGVCDWKKELVNSEKTDAYPSEQYHTIN